jgi:hypothetical protein
MVVIGVGEFSIFEITREPVTTTDSTGADASWAQTGQLDKLASKAISETVDLEFLNMKLPLDQRFLLVGRQKGVHHDIVDCKSILIISVKRQGDLRRSSREPSGLSNLRECSRKFVRCSEREGLCGETYF